ncbi:hypothetical protein TR51_18920 [Kitasatospora griseola]|uniref:Uncharacterized protein n=1 Tax=Kitasatospora griseola TaxID=2064 RepID=A0A0D0Q4F3_KITGR|nr:hypothetical protein TR51_18920 [Kitasatospora griseola]
MFRSFSDEDALFESGTMAAMRHRSVTTCQARSLTDRAIRFDRWLRCGTFAPAADVGAPVCASGGGAAVGGTEELPVVVVGVGLQAARAAAARSTAAVVVRRTFNIPRRVAGCLLDRSGGGGVVWAVCPDRDRSVGSAHGGDVDRGGGDRPSEGQDGFAQLQDDEQPDPLHHVLGVEDELPGVEDVSRQRVGEPHAEHVDGRGGGPPGQPRPGVEAGADEPSGTETAVHAVTRR